jgi:hypothetical protein
MNHFVFELKYDLDTIVYYKFDRDMVYKVRIVGVEEQVSLTGDKPPQVLRLTLYKVVKPNGDSMLVRVNNLFATPQDAFK